MNVAVAGTETNVFANVPYKGVGTYTPVAAGSYDLEVRVASSGAAVLPINGLALADGTVYTVVAAGLAGDGSLTVIPLVDAENTVTTTPTAPTTGTGLAETDGGMAPWMPLALALMALGGAVLIGVPALSRVSRN